MQEQDYWTFGKKEIVSIVVGGGLGTLLSLGLSAAPPWWFAPLPRTVTGLGGFDRWTNYAMQGGYEHFWFQSLVGWIVVGMVVGLVFSNVVLRGKTLD